MLRAQRRLHNLIPHFITPRIDHHQRHNTALHWRQMSMRAVQVKGGASNLASDLYVADNIDRPKLKPHEVLVKVRAFGLNRMDILQRMGKYPLPPGASTILGVEFSGTVEDAASSDLKTGSQVFGLAFGGAYAEYIAVDAGMVVTKPEHLSHAQAAAIPENWLTAYQCLFLVGQMKEGDNVLIHAGASGVGTSANQLARVFGAKHIITTAGSKAKCKFLKEKLGVTDAINYKTQDFAEEVKKLTDGKGVDVVLDFVGPDYWEKNIASLARDGRMVLIGLLSGMKTREGIDMAQILFKRLRIEGTTLRSRTPEYQADLLHQFKEKAMPKLLGEGLDLIIHKTYDWSQIVEATQEMEQAKNTGKIVMTIG
ncbi:uncharacterized protein L969DRAFT_94123 [Mixia osmundae IAM 14324]|uniref:Enoyl reductase (ER) domain-containing protein n=1 Tax=Mixia osmundae (strain CBS 9802 / IAM 14324 / JCM 22182 / KY 12970) TaxID=764103 RepID=G7E2S3_MIXOS|nr:uncharacterized protein L969DRAFT_94123 [Mixia osmundae IAM 14324]KEI40316.1 hypothetical protein L969DRAFT_94123 [Mixia osmundae IAM 14324]GAA97133.1 hypothetical protein E5Q_03808 [Mixia osmundae IAM 14324]